MKRGRGRPKGPPTCTITFRIPETMYAKIQQMAKSEDRQCSWIARKLVTSALDGLKAKTRM